MTFFKSVWCAVLLTFCVPSFSAPLLLNVPIGEVPASCASIDANKFSTLKLYKTFDGDIPNFRLYDGKWSPHLDGGYDSEANRWKGYDWVVKRTQPGAHEQQIYVDPLYKSSASFPLGLNPFSIADGNLTITGDIIPASLQRYFPGFRFTSGLLTTRTSFIQLYGYFEIDAIFPQGEHLLPAFWLLPFDKSWPPEIDVFEAPGQEPGFLRMTIHDRDSLGKLQHTGCKIALPSFSTSFHKYGVLWLPEGITYFIDRRPVAHIKTPSSFVKPMYMIVNLAIGGDWVGFKYDSNNLPVHLVVKDIAAYSTQQSPDCKRQVGGEILCRGN